MNEKPQNAITFPAVDNANLANTLIWWLTSAKQHVKEDAMWDQVRVLHEKSDLKRLFVAT